MVARDASGRRTSVLQTISEPRPGDSLNLTIDTKEQQNAQKALNWAMKTVGMKRGVVIVMNPQTGEIMALVSLPTYDNNQFARGISNADYAKLLNNPDKPLTQPRDPGALPARLDLQARRRHGRPGRQEDHADDEDPDAGLSHPRRQQVL